MTTTDRRPTRRRVISILAASTAFPFAGPVLAAGTPLESFTWRGVVLGASAELTLYASDRREASIIVGSCLDEIARLEEIFSLHRPDSAICRLNRDGHLGNPPHELVELLTLSLALSRLSRGAFDPTIQPLWEIVANHFAAAHSDPVGPTLEELERGRSLVDYRGVTVSADAIAFDRPGMQITLNGVAQGFVCDKVGALLAANGYRHALVNLGESLALDRHADGRAWRIAVTAPDDRSRSIVEFDLPAGAAATSAPNGLCFDASGRFNHIIDPTRLTCGDPVCSVTVVTRSAALADGLSTLGATLADPNRDFGFYLGKFKARAFVLSAADPEGRWLA